MNIGNDKAEAGMAQAIYTAMNKVLLEKMEKLMEKEKDEVKQPLISEAQDGWKKLSYAIAEGVIKHLQANPKTELNYAEIFSSSNEDETFWTWFANFFDELQKWASDPNKDPNQSVIDLKNSLNKFLKDSPVPKELRGIIR